jgi:hypothetical protein
MRGDAVNKVFCNLVFLVAPLGVGACAARTQSRTVDNPTQPTPVTDSVSPAHAAVDLAGVWATGSGGEPEDWRIELRPQCNYSPPLWILEQTGDTVSAFRVPESRAQGVRSPDLPPKVAARGRLSGADVTLESSGMRYVLHYDSTSGHLRGTLNGAPFWAVRLDIVQPTGCIPPP